MVIWGLRGCPPHHELVQIMSAICTDILISSNIFKTNTQIPHTISKGISNTVFIAPKHILDDCRCKFGTKLIRSREQHVTDPLTVFTGRQRWECRPDGMCEGAVGGGVVGDSMSQGLGEDGNCAVHTVCVLAVERHRGEAAGSERAH